MVKRTIEISREPCHLALRSGQMLVLRRAEPPKPLPANPVGLAGSIPVEDIGLLMVDERDTTYSQSLLVEIAEQGGALVVCGRDHHPVGMFLPLSTNTQLLARLDAQLNASKPVLKRLWQQIVREKIRRQAANISSPEIRTRIHSIANRVRSGDPDNCEAVAAAAYWPAIFAACNAVKQPFRRDSGNRLASPPNNLLDYGYAVLRATTARAIVSAGLLPAIGLKHVGRANPFCLADDLMEPLRPLMDARVRYLVARGELVLDQPTKAELLNVLAEPVWLDGERGPLMTAVARVVGRMVRILLGETPPDTLRFPSFTAKESSEARDVESGHAKGTPILGNVEEDDEIDESTGGTV